MGFAEIALPPGALDTLAAEYPAAAAMLRACNPHRLRGGEESAAYRVGQLVVRVGPRWRTAAQAEWACAVALTAAAQLPEALAPLTSASGRTILMLAGHPLSVWPYVAGRQADRENPAHFRAAAELLARLHTALAAASLGPQPGNEHSLGDGSDLADPDLDVWLTTFFQACPRRQALHGDYYPGNLLARGDRLAAVLDWDEAYIGTPDSELAAAAWEWGDGLRTGQLGRAARCTMLYRQAGGSAPPLTETALRQLTRQRLRWEIRYKRTTAMTGASTADDAYTGAQAAAYWELRPGHIRTSVPWRRGSSSTTFSAESRCTWCRTCW